MTQNKFSVITIFNLIRDHQKRDRYPLIIKESRWNSWKPWTHFMSAGACPDWESFKTKHFLLPQLWPRLLAILGMAIPSHTWTAASPKGKLSIRFKLYIDSVFNPTTSSDRIKDKTYLKLYGKITVWCQRMPVLCFLSLAPGWHFSDKPGQPRQPGLGSV